MGRTGFQKKRHREALLLGNGDNRFPPSHVGVLLGTEWHGRLEALIESLVPRRSVTFLVFVLGMTLTEWVGAAPDFEKEVRPILQQYCFSCHGPEKQKGKLRLDTLSPDLVKERRSAEHWHEVRAALNLGEMPPEGKAAPNDEERRVILEWLNNAIAKANEAHRSTGGRVVMRRLNNAEYQNTMHDLIGLDVTYARDLPPDAVSPEGMRNNGTALQMTGLQFEYYLKAAREALDRVIVTGEAPEVFEHRFEKSTEGRWVDKVQPSNRIGDKREFLVRIKEKYPDQGAFRIRIRARADIPDETSAVPYMKVFVGYRPDTLVDRELLQALSVTNKEAQEFEFVGQLENFPMPVRKQGKFPGLVLSVVNEGSNIEIESLEFKAPLFETWPPAHHRRILPESAERESNESGYARKVIAKFLARAWRRPVTEQEIDRFHRFFEKVRPEMPSFEEAIKEALAMALVSPSFLYILEPDSEKNRTLHSYELASRLSYFLWSTMPDENLLESARSGALAKKEGLQTQVARMIADPRSDRFITQFTNQWLDLDAGGRLVIDQKIYPGFRPSLKEEMRRETLSFFGQVLRENLSARYFLDSDFAMLNDRMAQHYGMVGIRGRNFRRVSLSGDHAKRRGGLLTQAAILLGTSTGVDAHLIKRGVFVRKRILGDPPAPPPPNVPELETAEKDFASLPIREQLKRHLEDAACADCHRGIDPWGYALQEFDAVGKWRHEVVRPLAGGKKITLPVDAQAKLPDGREVTGIAELQTYLLKHRKEQFARALVSKLLTYALGRSLEFSDQAVIDTLTQDFLKNDLRLADLVHGIAASAIFQTK